ncbi:hypothetical protein NQ036_06790 [Brevibacterium sp. 91QC2O2]|uniref:hypothetical protein n=1 Tax=Brevibacterium sp. 91QC2O2 TaxID=2968458 RepID=UPI00211B88B2|nr:hypothetical protein [Brevibacterium sp. 91QC2O2]MCQ9367950.1 hypothetical protein [Brevibacterium sp. 91QC2O2]
MSIQIKRATRIVKLVTDLSLRAEYDQAVEDLDRARKATTTDNRLTGSTEARNAAQRVVDLEKAMDDSIVLVTLTALPSAKYEEIKEKHPAREDNDVDSRFGVNVDAFFPVAITESVVIVRAKATGETVEMEAGEWPQLLEDISNAQFSDFVDAVLELNQVSSEVPFSRLASSLIQG